MYRDPSRKPTYDEEITARVVIRERGFEVVHPHFVKVSGWSMTLNAVAFVGFWLYWALRPLPPPPPASVECPPAVECPPLPESEPEIEPEVGPSIEAALLRGPSLRCDGRRSYFVGVLIRVASRVFCWIFLWLPVRV
jgi:hypothetical protein